jgi:hypothetical protein
MKINENELREKIINALKSQGFAINPHLRPENDEKDTIKKVHEQKRKEQLKSHKNFLIKNIKKIRETSISGKELQPDRINLELFEVAPDTYHSKLFFWWNLVWWSIPYDKPIGRQMRYLLWDSYHDAPFGLFCLQSPPLRSTVRDRFLGLNNGNIDYWINQSLYGQRIGALPPYNELLGGKMVTLSITSNEVREAYTKKYRGKKTLLKDRELPSRLLFVTTTSAYGKSSVYERIVYNGGPVSHFIGYTTGSGTFQVPEELYLECLQYLEEKGKDIKRGYGTGPSRKMKLIANAFSYLKIPTMAYHNIKRGYYLLSNVENLKGVIHQNQEPIWNDRPFDKLAKFWLKRWCIPRSIRIDDWRAFEKEDFFRRAEHEFFNL